MTKRHSVRVSAIAIVSACPALAQPNSVELDWQVSADHGATWQGGDVEVSSSQFSVLVRLRASWVDRGLDDYFSVTAFDALVRTPGRLSADVADMFNIGISLPWTGTFNTMGFATQRFGDTLKVDDSRDAMQPGVGDRWVMPFQIPPPFPIAHPENPTILFSYRLGFDGVPGPRAISGVFRTSPLRPPDHLAGLYARPSPEVTTYVPTTINNASVTVVPAPGAVLLVMAAMGVLRRRRQDARRFLSSPAVVISRIRP